VPFPTIGDGSTPEMRYVKSQIKFLAQEAHGLELQVDTSYEALSDSIKDLEGFLCWVDGRFDHYEKAMIHLLESHIPEPAFRYFQLPPECAQKRCHLYSPSTPPPQLFFGLSSPKFKMGLEESIGSLPNWRPAAPTPESAASVGLGVGGPMTGVGLGGSTPPLHKQCSPSTSLPSPHQPPPPSPSPQVGIFQENTLMTSSVGWILY
jgi:hypothetical protein